MTERNPSAPLTIVIGLQHRASTLGSWLGRVYAALSGVASRLQCIVVAPFNDPTVVRITQERAIELVYEPDISHVVLARIAAVWAVHPFVLACLLNSEDLPTTEAILALWQSRHHADMLIASPVAKEPSARLANLSGRLLRRVLSLPTREVFGSCRLYRRDVLAAVACQLPNEAGVMADVELLLHITAEGYQARDISVVLNGKPASHRPGTWTILPHARRLASLWRLRNSILSADYDDRAYDSIIPLQRYWQRQRYRFITELIDGEGAVLDVGCGSSRILSALPAGSLGVDVLFRKLRYARRFQPALIQASGFHLPVADGAFPCVLCSQVIEHVPKTSPILRELCRALKLGGRLVIGTPDYDHWEWRATEWLYARCAPGGYADEHIAHYSREELLDYFESRGFTHEATRYILRGELIMAFRKRRSEK